MVPLLYMHWRAGVGMVESFMALRLIRLLPLQQGIMLLPMVSQTRTRWPTVDFLWSVCTV